MDHEDFSLRCERFSIHVGVHTHTQLSPNQGFLIPLCENIILYIGYSTVYDKIPWMDTFAWAWSFYSEIEQDVEFIRIKPVHDAIVEGEK